MTSGDHILDCLQMFGSSTKNSSEKKVSKFPFHLCSFCFSSHTFLPWPQFLQECFASSLSSLKNIVLSPVDWHPGTIFWITLQVLEVVARRINLSEGYIPHWTSPIWSVSPAEGESSAQGDSSKFCIFRVYIVHVESSASGFDLCSGYFSSHVFLP